jgi:hypothetical protein
VGEVPDRDGEELIPMLTPSGGRHRPIVRLAMALSSPGSYGMVVVLIVVSYVLAVSVTSARASTLTLAVQMMAAWLAFHTSQARHSTMIVVDILVSAALVVGVANVFVVSAGEDPTGVLLAGCVAYFLSPFAIIRYVGSKPTVELESVLGAVAAYLMLGMFFAFAYALLADVQSGPFFGDAGDGDMGDSLFFSFITLTTVGYGNLVPASSLGQSLAVVEAVAGQLFLVTAVAKIISAWKPRARAVAGAGSSGPAGDGPAAVEAVTES